MQLRLIIKMTAIWLLLTAISHSWAQVDPAKVDIKPIELAPGVHALLGAGGNMGLLTGPDGAVLIDDQFAPLAPKIRAAVALLSDKPVRFVINTHWHFDHTGGNEAFGRSGSIIIAHDKTLERLSSEQVVEFFNVKTPPSPRAALPVITFASGLSLHLNGQQVEALHVKNAHTDTDVLLFLSPANVIHTGDVYLNGAYPFIDMGSGGSLDGVRAACATLLARSDDRTRIIPGHGPISGRAELTAWCAMLDTVRERIFAAVRAGRTLEQTLASKPTAEFDASYGKGAMTPDVWVQRVYLDLRRTASARGRR